MRTIALLLASTLLVTHGDTSHRREFSSEPIGGNDNRIPAGVLKDGTLALNLEVRRGSWFPDGPSNPSIEVHAFAEAGKALQVPGPLLRVTEGTEIHATIRNTLDSTVVVHGLYTRDRRARAATDTIRIAGGGTREIRFQAGQPGTYFYWGATSTVPNWNADHGTLDSQLSGAFVVDPRGTSGAARDRVLLLGVWANGNLAEAGDRSTVVTRFVINGRAWPQTERLTYTLGESIHWRLINASEEVHPMHLHGFYFRVHSRGSEDVDTRTRPARRLTLR